MTFILVNLNLFFVHKSLLRESYRQLNRNLTKVRSYWSIDRGSLITIGGGEVVIDKIEAAEYQRSFKSAWLFGSLLIPLSWIGLFFMCLYWVSMKYFMRSETEHNIFASVLTKSDLDRDEVYKILNELRIDLPQVDETEPSSQRIYGGNDEAR